MLGMAISSPSSDWRPLSTRAESTVCDAGAWLRHFSEFLRLGERPELLEALVLDLANPLTRDAEGATDLVECPGMLAVQAVAKLENATLTIRKRRKDTLERFP